MRFSSDLTLHEMNADGFPATVAALRAGVAESVAPGMVAGLWELKRPDEIRVAALGQRRLAIEGLPALPMEAETPFDLASVSKVFGTAALAAVLVERRWIRWETPLAAFFPGYPHRDILLRHLLSHTAGFAAWEPFWEKIRARHAGGRPLWAVPVETRQRDMRELMLAVAPEAAPGQRTVYSDICFMLLGFALEEATSLPLDRAVRALVWDPMGIEEAWYRHTDMDAPSARDDRVAATELCPWRGMLEGQVHDDNTWTMGGYAGHAGAFASAREVLHFARALVEGRFLSPETLRAAWERVSEPPGCERTLGWDTPSGEEPSASKLFSPRTVGHLGFTGTSLWIDRDAGLAAVLLTNRVHPTRENTKIRAFRPVFHAALRRDLGY